MKTCLLPQGFPPAGFIPRHLYDGLLKKLVTHRLTLLWAPAGYGKSTALAHCFQHLHRVDAQGLWVSGEQWAGADADSFLQAIAEQLPGHLALTPGGLLAGLQAFKGRRVIFIDAYEQLESPAITALMEQLLQLNLPHWHIALASRRQPALKLSALESRGQLHSIGAEQLSFSNDEASLLLHQDLPASQRQLLYQQTEGWPLAVNLCHVLARDKKHSANLVAFSGRDQSLRVFFQEQVLAHLNDEQQRFLRDFAVLGTGSKALCNYVLQRHDSHQLLENLYQAGAFLEVRDRNLNDYRMHPLLREHLLDPTAPQANQRKLFVRATRWSIRHQCYRQAADYAKASGEPRIARLVIGKTSEILVRNLGELPTLVDWTRDVQVGALFEWNQLVYWSTWSLAFSYCWQEANKRLEQLTLATRNNVALGAEERRNYESKLDSLSLVLAIFQDYTLGVAERAALWLARHEDADAFDIAVIASAQLIALRLDADCHGAVQAAGRALSVIHRSGSVYGNIWVNLLNALYQMEFGDYNRARLQLNEQFYRAALEIGEHSAISSTCALLLSRISYEQDDLESARGYVDIGYRHIKSHGLIESAIAGISTRARLAALNNLCEALQVLDDAHSIVAIYPARLESLLHQQRIELLLDHGRSNEALIAASALEQLLTRAEHHDTRVVPRLNQAYLEMLLNCARGYHDEALNGCHELLEQTAVVSQPLLHCKLLIVQAALLGQDQGRTDEAGKLFRKALSVASENGLYRVFIDLKRFASLQLQLQLDAGDSGLDGRERDLFSRLCEALQLQAPANRKSQHLPEPLSRRELELLALLESGLTYQQMADQLFISLATVKWHVYNIYGKLGVKNRSGALVAARQLHLLSNG